MVLGGAETDARQEHDDDAEEDAAEEIGRLLDIDYREYDPVTEEHGATLCSLRVRTATLALPGHGTYLWKGGTLLGRLLVACPALVQDQGILEIGAGTGVSGLTAWALGARCVLLTDGATPVIENITTTLRMAYEGHAARLLCGSLDFCLENEGELDEALERLLAGLDASCKGPEVLLASEVGYTWAKLDGVAQTIAAFFKRGGQLAIVSSAWGSACSNKRDGVKHLASCLEGRGLVARAFWDGAAETVEGGQTVLVSWPPAAADVTGAGRVPGLEALLSGGPLDLVEHVRHRIAREEKLYAAAASSCAAQSASGDQEAAGSDEKTAACEASRKDGSWLDALD
eukprot:TRINITY_DN59019_c0_g1_i1.p1 TRINITY_DN59019_c0_g1~~TRINITY_DN59019_c0_g1_i1.p1  ORF type:complete len:343 (-),score=76.13 TRINITY_DN59019_c0_g1_i1:250-1278(-)